MWRYDPNRLADGKQDPDRLCRLADRLEIQRYVGAVGTNITEVHQVQRGQANLGDARRHANYFLTSPPDAGMIDATPGLSAWQTG